MTVYCKRGISTYVHDLNYSEQLKRLLLHVIRIHRNVTLIVDPVTSWRSAADDAGLYFSQRKLPPCQHRHPRPSSLATGFVRPVIS